MSVIVIKFLTVMRESIRELLTISKMLYKQALLKVIDTDEMNMYTLLEKLCKFIFFYF